MNPLLRLDPTSRMLRFVTNDDGGGGTGDGTPPPAAVQFSEEQQAAIDRIVQGRVAQAQRTARQSAEQEIKDYLEAQAEEARRNELNEIDRLKAEKAEADARAAQALADAAKERFDAKVERKLTAAKVDEKALTRATRLITLGPDATDEELDAEIEALKTDVPGLFSTGEATPPPPGSHLKPPATSTTTTGGQTAKERAQARLERRIPHRKPAA